MKLYSFPLLPQLSLSGRGGFQSDGPPACQGPEQSYHPSVSLQQAKPGPSDLRVSPAGAGGAAVQSGLLGRTPAPCPGLSRNLLSPLPMLAGPGYWEILGGLAGAGLALTFLKLRVPALAGGRGHEATGPRAPNPYRWFPPASLAR